MILSSPDWLTPINNFTILDIMNREIVTNNMAYDKINHFRLVGNTMPIHIEEVADKAIVDWAKVLISRQSTRWADESENPQ